MAFSFSQFFSTVTLLCVVINLGLCYVPVHERPSRIPDRSRPADTVEERPSILTRLPIRRPHQPGPRITSHIALAGVIRRLAAIESWRTTSDRNYEKLSAKVSGLLLRIQDLQQTVEEANSPQPEPLAELRSANLDLETRVSRLETENEGLRQFLVAFEQFFNRLTSADPAAYDPTAAPAERLSRLHQYLGNSEAELIDVSRQTLMTSADGDDAMEQDNIDDHPMTGETAQVVEQWETVNIFVAENGNNTASGDRNIPRKGTSSRVGPRPSQGITMSVSSSSSSTSSKATPDRGSGVHLSTSEADRLAIALEQLETRNQELTTRLQALEGQATESGPFGGGVNTFGVSSSPDAKSNAITEELLNKVELLEQVVALQASSILDDTPTPDLNSPRGPTGDRGISAAAKGSSGTSQVSSTSMRREDVTIMKEVLEETRNSKSSSRKSAFSVARMTPLRGTADQHQVVEFDHVFVNKGRDFDTRNSTFICERAGYYFITFHLRSYDGLYLGVSLMKNGEIVSAVFTDAHERNVMEGQSVVLHLEPGDNLYLLLAPSPDFGLHSNNRKYVTFSGFMIYSGY